jgi:osmoprotectant transport system substrate-binding protein
MKPIRTAVSAAAVLVLLAACGSSDKSGNPLANNTAKAGTVTVGSANFPENVLLAEIYAQVLEKAGAKVDRKFNIGSREVIFGQIKTGGLTVLPEYNGALLAYVDKTSTASTTDAVDTALKSKLPSTLDLLDPAKAEDKDSVTVTKDTAAKYHLTYLADLAPVAKDLVLGGPPEFKTRKQGVVGLKSEYGVEFKSFKSLDVAGPITVSALKKGDIQAANLFTTDPAIDANGFVPLLDPKNLFGAQNVTPLVYKSGITDKERSALNAVSAKLDTATLATMVKKLVVDKQDEAQLAKDWISSAGL